MCQESVGSDRNVRERGERESHERDHGPERQRAGLHVHDLGRAGGRRRQNGHVALTGHAAGRADHARLGRHGRQRAQLAHGRERRVRHGRQARHANEGGDLLAGRNHHLRSGRAGESSCAPRVHPVRGGCHASGSRTRRTRQGLLEKQRRKKQKKKNKTWRFKPNKQQFYNSFVFIELSYLILYSFFI